MSPSTIAVAILLVALAGFAVAYYVVLGRRRRGPRMRGDIPLAMRPYFSDEELEGPALERAMAWGVALTVFVGLFLPLYWLIEPARIEDKREDFYERDVAAGREAFAQNCAQCHGENAQGGFASHPDPDVTAPWPAPALNNIVARYEDSEIVTDVEQFLTRTIRQGRPGTPMPAWSTAFGGPMNDLQIQQIVTYLLSIQTGETEGPKAFSGQSGRQIFEANCARCHGFDASGRVGPSLLTEAARFGGGEEAWQAIRSTIRKGRLVPTGAPMPPFEDELTTGALDRLIEYLKSIQRETGSG